MYALRSTVAHCSNFILQKTLSPCLPPRLPERPNLPLRYPIISTRKLVDISDAPTPPPRATPANANFVSYITKNDVNSATNFHTSTIRFTEGKDKAKLKLTISSNHRKVPQTNAQAPCNGNALKLTAPPVGCRQTQDSGMLTRAPRPPLRITPKKGILQEVIVICAFVIISTLYYFIKQKWIAFVP